MPLDRPRPKTAKRMMEKKRRARINESLTELKNLVLNAMNKNSPRHSKLEKADILEMTVKYLRGEHRSNITDHRPSTLSRTPESTDVIQYRSGFAACVKEVSRYFDELGDGEPSLKLQLINHLGRLCTSDNNTRQAPHRAPVATFPIPPITFPSQVPKHSEGTSAVLPNSHVQSVPTMQVNIHPPSVSTMPSFSHIPSSHTLSFQRPGTFTSSTTLSSKSENSLIPQNHSAVIPVAFEKVPDNITSKQNSLLAHQLREPETQNGIQLAPVCPPATSSDLMLVFSQPLVSGGHIPIQFIPVYPHMPSSVPPTASSRNLETVIHSQPTVTVSNSNAVMQSPCAGSLAPTSIAFYARPTIVSNQVGLGQGSAGTVIAQNAVPGMASVMPIQAQPFTITFPVNARIVQHSTDRQVSLIPTATISPIVPASEGPPPQVLSRVPNLNVFEPRPKRPWED